MLCLAGRCLHFYSFRAHDFPSSIVERIVGTLDLWLTPPPTTQPLVSPKQGSFALLASQHTLKQHYGLLETIQKMEDNSYARLQDCRLAWLNFDKSGQITLPRLSGPDFWLTWRMPPIFWCHTHTKRTPAHMKIGFFTNKVKKLTPSEFHENSFFAHFWCAGNDSDWVFNISKW